MISWRIFNSLRNKNSKNFQWTVYERFLNGDEGFETSDGLKASIKKARNLRKYLKAYFSAGKAARKNAIFIGVERYLLLTSNFGPSTEGSYFLRFPLEELVQLEKKSMVELKSLAVCGHQNGRISDVDPNLGGPNYVVLEDSVHRVCAPTDGEAHPIIFWTKDSQSDTTPTSGKIVSIDSFSNLHFSHIC
jgi:hypothetical protein